MDFIFYVKIERQNNGQNLKKKKNIDKEKEDRENKYYSINVLKLMC